VTNTITPNADTTDVLEYSPMTGNAVMQLPSGTPTAGQIMRINFVSTGSNHTVTWAGTGYRPSGSAPIIIAVPTSKMYLHEFIYVTAGGLNKWCLFNQPTGIPSV
jgi:hypothetical protein